MKPRLRTGLVLLDKPVGPTSRDALDEAERRLDLRRGSTGHAGTLDPLASGLLIMLVGRARRLQGLFASGLKRYRAEVRFGATTISGDAEPPVVPTDGPPPPTAPEQREALLDRFRGESLQTPPAVSALKIGGRRAHALAREGRPVVPAPRRVRIEPLRLVAATETDWTLDVSCSPGTYVRSLARDLGEAVGCGAYLSSLRRVASGEFLAEEAVAPSAASWSDVRTLADVLKGRRRVELLAADVSALARGRGVETPGVEDFGEPFFGWCDGRPQFLLRVLRPGFCRAERVLDDDADA